MKTAVILISEQTLPNVLFIKQFIHFDRFLFLSTPLMEKRHKSESIKNASGISSHFVQLIEIDPENANYSLHHLKEQLPDLTDDEIVVNLTGGTKMMALATYAYFTNFNQSKIIYLPINSENFIEIYPGSSDIPMSESVNLSEYLLAHGVVIQSETELWEDSILFDESSRILRNIPDSSLPDRGVLNRLSENEQKVFYSGGWLELWLANQVHNLLNVPVQDIKVNAKLNRIGIAKDVSYEYDVIFVKGNRLYAAECKSFISNKFKIDKIHKEIFKFASISQQLGLYAKPFVLIANSIDRQSTQYQQLSEYCKLLRIATPLFLDIIREHSKFVNYVRAL